MSESGTLDQLDSQKAAEAADRAPAAVPDRQPAFRLHAVQTPPQRQSIPPVIAFNRHELQTILNVYGRQVAAGEWRDYALDFGAQTAVFSIFRRSSEMPLYRVVKDPRLARKQGMYSVITATGLILKRGQELDRVIAVLDKKLKLVER